VIYFWIIDSSAKGTLIVAAALVSVGIQSKGGSEMAAT